MILLETEHVTNRAIIPRKISVSANWTGSDKWTGKHHFYRSVPLPGTGNENWAVNIESICNSGTGGLATSLYVSMTTSISGSANGVVGGVVEHTVNAGNFFFVAGFGSNLNIVNGTFGNALGLPVTINVSGGNITDLAGLQVSFELTGGSTDHVMGLRIFETGGLGSVQRLDGIWIGNLSQGSLSNYAINTEGSTPSLFGGNVTVGSLNSAGNVVGTNFYASGDGNFFGSLGVGGTLGVAGITAINNHVWIYSDAADVGDPLVDSPYIALRGSSWNGVSADVKEMRLYVEPSLTLHSLIIENPGGAKCAIQPYVNYTNIIGGTTANSQLKLSGDGNDTVINIVGSSYVEFNKSIFIKGSFFSDTVNKSSNYVITDNDNINTIFMTTGAGDKTITLPTVVDNVDRIIKIMKVDSGAGKCTVSGEGGETINGNPSRELSDAYDVIVVQSTGTEWVMLSAYF